MGKKKPEAVKANGKSPRKNNEWAGVPRDTTEASWDIFLTCGRVVLDAYDKKRKGFPPDSGPRLKILLGAADAKRPRDGETAEKAENLEEDFPFAERRSNPRRRETVEKELRLAIDTLTADPGVDFPFVIEPNGFTPPSSCVVLIAMLCARYVFHGEIGLIKQLRPFLQLLHVLPHAWEETGRAISGYTRRRSARLHLLLPENAPSALDGMIALSSKAFADILNIAPPDVAPGDEYSPDIFSEPRFFRNAGGRSGRRRPRPRSPRREPERHSGLAIITKPKLKLDDLVLSDGLKEEIRLVALLCRRRKTAAPKLLFHGLPGTGKTHAAAAFAGEIGRKLATANIAAIADKYVGQTEKHLQGIFEEAESLNAVLLLDEADTLLHSREFAIHSFEVSWVNTLLKLLEKPAVPVILCTNFAKKLDPAVHRRIESVIVFPLPGFKERIAIWQRELRLARIRKKLDIDALARIRLTGALIANAARRAALRRQLLGSEFKLDTESLMKLARDETAKLAGADEATKVRIGYGGGMDVMREEGGRK